MLKPSLECTGRLGLNLKEKYGEIVQQYLGIVILRHYKIGGMIFGLQYFKSQDDNIKYSMRLNVGWYPFWRTIYYIRPIRHYYHICFIIFL